MQCRQKYKSYQMRSFCMFTGVKSAGLQALPERGSLLLRILIMGLVLRSSWSKMHLRIWMKLWVPFLELGGCPQHCSNSCVSLIPQEEIHGLSWQIDCPHMFVEIQCKGDGVWFCCRDLIQENESWHLQEWLHQKTVIQKWGTLIQLLSRNQLLWRSRKGREELRQTRWKLAVHFPLWRAIFFFLLWGSSGGVFKGERWIGDPLLIHHVLPLPHSKKTYH